jgi:hypothetical protein
VHSPREIESIGLEPNKFISEEIGGKCLFCDCTAVSLLQRSAGKISRNYCPSSMARSSTKTSVDSHNNISGQSLMLTRAKEIAKKNQVDSYSENARQ